MSRIKSVMVAAAVLLSLATQASSQDKPDASELLKRVSKTYKNLKSYHFELLSVTESTITGERVKQTSESEQRIVSAAAPHDRLRIEVSNPYLTVTAISDGKMEWIYLPGLNQYTVAATGESDVDEGGLIASFTSQALNLVSSYEHTFERLKEADIKREETIEVNGQQIPCYVVEGTYKDKSPSVEPPSVSYWIDKTRNIILREIDEVKTKTPYGSLMQTKTTTRFTVASIDKPAPDDLFAFSPPASAEKVAELNLPGTNRPASRASEMAGKQAEDFTLEDLKGQQVSLKSLRGKVVLLNFWASWCGPCRVEMPNLEKLHREFKDKDLVVLGINTEEAENARKFFKSSGFSFTTLLDEQQQVAASYHITAIPQVFIIGRDGKIVAHYIGARSEDELRAGLKQAGIGAAQPASR